MRSFRMRKLLLLSFTLFGMSFYSLRAEEVKFVEKDGYVIGGYDVVAYFLDNDDKKGEEQFMATWRGQKWLFISDENRKVFLANPEKYAPQYRGYCVQGVGNNKIYVGNGKYWSIKEGKLYLNYNYFTQFLYKRNVEKRLELAKKYWSEVKRKILEKQKEGGIS